MDHFTSLEVWFVIGSQHLYGAETLRQVKDNAEKVVAGLNQDARLPVRLVLKPLVKPRTKSARCAATPTIRIAASVCWSGCIPSPRQDVDRRAQHSA